MKNTELIKFLLESNKAGYATGDMKAWTKEKDGSTTIKYDSGDWKSHDNFFGGEPYGGRLVVSYEDRPVWIMVYYGWVEKGVDADEVYAMLRKAMKKMPETAPFRGPKELKTKEFTYTNKWTGDIESYKGQEEIYKDGKLIYQAEYMGGLVDLRRGV